ncbi:MAG: ATP-dependent 6-phosphofructokinase [Spirochaetales bacterium]|nr:ATP-dependent 6-phosphofructokinase [Spirochaetales bacterium]
MEHIDLTPEQLAVRILGEARVDSPLGLSSRDGDFIANYVADDDTVVLLHDGKKIEAAVKRGDSLPAFVKAGPRDKIFFSPRRVRAAIVTCGGLCPGINNVIRALVMELHYSYGVESIWGVPYGFRGFIKDYGLPARRLTPDLVKGIHELGGSFLGSSRGPQPTAAIVDWLREKEISILFAIGGDGTLRGAADIDAEVARRGLAVSVVGIPKTIDNDIPYVEKTFGLETAFAVATEAIRSAHTEALGAPGGIGLVKLMGRYSGFIAANAALALNEVNFVLIPEVPFDLEGPKGFLALLKQRLSEKDHAVIVAAEGAGQELFGKRDRASDNSGNRKLGDIGLFLKERIRGYFAGEAMDVTMKYIDPSYLIRSVAAHAADAVYCLQLAQHAVHAGMRGYSGLVVGRWNGQFTYVPLALANSARKFVSPDGELWRAVLEATGQPYRMTNE